MEKLANLIINTSIASTKELVNLIKESSEKNKQLKELQIFEEFLCFYSHMVNRFAFAILGDETRIKLQKKLGPLLVENIVENFIGHWPKDLKEKRYLEIYENINSAEKEYSQCKKIIPEKDNFLDKSALFSRLSINVSDYLDATDQNEDFIFKIFQVAFENFKKMNLKDSVKTIEIK